MATATYLDTNISDKNKTQEILIIDMKPKDRCCNWFKKKLGFNAYKWRRKWRTWKWYLCFFGFISLLVTVIVLLKLPWKVYVKKDEAGNCPLYSHEVPNKSGGFSCLRELCFNRKENYLLDENGFCQKSCENELTTYNLEENICEIECLEGQLYHRSVSRCLFDI